MLELKSVSINNENVSLLNTYTFDSISQVIFCAYADSENYEKIVNNNVKHVYEVSLSRFT